MKVLWFSNAVFNGNTPKATGTWLYSMANALIDRGVELYNITQKKDVVEIQFNEIDDIKQWILPEYKLYNGLPRLKYIKQIQTLVDNIKPDIIHIWGVESY